ncbi:stage II sporulation protein M [Candidatus Pacearchaeota archaeon]|nr:stage II sporulation protein M [Candidatus Pacearchaeota archaeon]
MIKKNTIKRNFFADNYIKSWVYLKESKDFFYLIIGIFFFFVLFAFLLPPPKEISDLILNFLKELIEETKGMNAPELAQFIFVNNIQTSFLGMFFGILFGIYPVIVAVFNGYVVGFVSLIAVNEGGFSVLWQFLPHGIFELPAVFISLGMGTKLGTFVFAKHKKRAFLNYFSNSIRVFLFVVLPLLIIAAIIESSFISYLG